jgi:FtsP/CotA-like multicopper oxidase with cupredoxin domain
VLLSSFDIQPPTMKFRAGEPLRLRLINNSVQTHSFSARGFFSAGEVRTRERKAVGNGTVSVGPGETREILIVPAAGRFSARCSNLFHRVMGMTAKIVVE